MCVIYPQIHLDAMNFYPLSLDIQDQVRKATQLSCDSSNMWNSFGKYGIMVFYVTKRRWTKEDGVNLSVHIKKNTLC